MANPFGPIVDNFEMEKFPPYPSRLDINQIDRARTALRWRTDNNKARQAENYVTELKRLYGTGASTHCLIFNATGFSLQYVSDSDFSGLLFRTPYPWEIGNGQWVSFLHTQRYQVASDSEAGVVYRCTNKSGQQRDVFIGWRTVGGPGGGTGNRNSVYADVIARGATLPWTTWLNALRRASSSNIYIKDGIRIEIDIASNTSPFFRATITLPDI